MSQGHISTLGSGCLKAACERTVEQFDSRAVVRVSAIVRRQQAGNMCGVCHSLALFRLLSSAVIDVSPVACIVLDLFTPGVYSSPRRVISPRWTGRSTPIYGLITDIWTGEYIISPTGEPYKRSSAPDRQRPNPDAETLQLEKLIIQDHK